MILILVIKTRKILEIITAKKGLKNYYMQNGILDGILEIEMIAQRQDIKGSQWQ